MRNFQTGILAEIPNFGRYVFFDLIKGATDDAIREALNTLTPKPRQMGVASGHVVVGIGLQTAQAVGYTVEGLREFKTLTTSSKVNVPSQPAALLLWLRGDSKTALVQLEQLLVQQLRGGFVWRESVVAFKHTLGKDTTSRDLTGYEDGTENPEGADARAAAFVRSTDAVLNGSSFLALQRWEHNWAVFGAMAQPARDAAVGRRQSDNEELDDAPISAHVKRTAQEDFEPEAFVLRRSMPWQSESAGHSQAGKTPPDQAPSGLMFAAFGKSFDAFEAQMRRMAGLDDGVVDALFQFSKPLATSYFWCPPLGK
jgi:porphyrinogen peroxidase